MQGGDWGGLGRGGEIRIFSCFLCHFGWFGGWEEVSWRRKVIDTVVFSAISLASPAPGDEFGGEIDFDITFSPPEAPAKIFRKAKMAENLGDSGEFLRQCLLFGSILRPAKF